jgi:hypothetical protein
MSDYQQQRGVISHNWGLDHALSDVATCDSKLASGLCVSRRALVLELQKQVLLIDISLELSLNRPSYLPCVVTPSRQGNVLPWVNLHERQALWACRPRPQEAGGEHNSSLECLAVSGFSKHAARCTFEQEKRRKDGRVVGVYMLYNRCYYSQLRQCTTHHFHTPVYRG